MTDERINNGFCKFLPFPRGRTMSDFGAVTPNSTLWTELDGMKFEIIDEDTQITIRLRIMRNGPFPLRVAKNVRYESLVIDDAYEVDDVIPAHDLFYVKF